MIVIPLRSTTGVIRPESVSTSGTVGPASVEAHRERLATLDFQADGCAKS